MNTALQVGSEVLLMAVTVKAYYGFSVATPYSSMRAQTFGAIYRLHRLLLLAPLPKMKAAACSSQTLGRSRRTMLQYGSNPSDL
jgi:hypothetical protein